MSLRTLVTIILLLISAFFAYMGFDGKDTYDMLLALWLLGVALLVPHFVPVNLPQ